MIEHLYPDASNVTLWYICGHSFGSVAKQILYAPPPSFFPAGRNIRGLLLISAFPPFGEDNEKGFIYTKNTAWSTYISVGPPILFIPFRLLQQALKLAIKPNLSCQPKAESLSDDSYLILWEQKRRLFRARNSGIDAEKRRENVGGVSEPCRCPAQRLGLEKQSIKEDVHPGKESVDCWR